MIALPPPLAASPWAARLDVAINAVRAAGVALLALRGQIAGTEAAGGQLKTAIDLAAEGWVLGFLEGSFPGEIFLAEERFDREGVAWPGAPTYWTIDALDGTRSYVEGFDGFCVQVAYVEGGVPRVGVICEPVTGAIYAGAAGAGAWKLADGRATQLTGPAVRAAGPELRDVDSTRPTSATAALWPGLRFVDSTRPTDGAIGALFAATQGQLVECGSVGLKICRLVEDAADVYVKRFAPKLWDVAPGEVLIRETGGVLASWDGAPFDYAGARTHYDGVVVASGALYPALRAALTDS